MRVGVINTNTQFSEGKTEFSTYSLLQKLFESEYKLGKVFYIISVP